MASAQGDRCEVQRARRADRWQINGVASLAGDESAARIRGLVASSCRSLRVCCLPELGRFMFEMLAILPVDELAPRFYFPLELLVA